MAECSQINNTTIIGTSAVKYDSTPLPCTDVNACDGLNIILAKFDTVICDVKANVDILTEEIITLTEDVMVITEDVNNIYNQLDVCCPTTTTTTTVVPTTTTTTTIVPTTTTTSSSTSSTTTSTTSTSSSTTSTSTTATPTTTTTSSSTSTSTSSTTTTTTTTVAPTTTTTTTPSGLRQGSISSKSHPTDACSSTLDTGCWISNTAGAPGFETVSVSSVVYTNPGGTIPFIGDGDFYHIEIDFSSASTNCQVNGTGNVDSAIGICY